MENLHQCINCKLTPLQTEFGRIKGTLRNKCKACRSIENWERKWSKEGDRARFKTRRDPTAMNYQALITTSNPTLQIMHRLSGKIIGLIAFNDDLVFIRTWKQDLIVKIDLIGIAVYIGNMNLIITPNSADFDLKDWPTLEPKYIQNILRGLQRGLRRKAIKDLRVSVE